MSMNEQQSWYFCLRHQRVEPEDGCPGKDRLGPYASREEAARAIETVHRRNEEWDAADRDNG
jgi:hypothetical protein